MRRANRNWIAGFLAGLLLFAVAFLPGPAAAQTASVASLPEEETLVYNIGFLIFRKAADGSMALRYLPKRDLYEGVLQAKTKGFISWVSLAREDTYRSLMRLSPDGRLIPVEFFKEVHTWSYQITSRTVLDYESGVMRWKTTEVIGGKTSIEEKSQPIPPGVIYEDFISAFFNLRRGAYGSIRPGQNFRILSLPTDQWFEKKAEEPQYFLVRIDPAQEKGLSQTVVSIHVPEDLFGQTVGDIQFHMRQYFIPSRILVKKALIFGNMEGNLIRVMKGQGAPPAA